MQCGDCRCVIVYRSAKFWNIRAIQFVLEGEGGKSQIRTSIRLYIRTWYEYYIASFVCNYYWVYRLPISIRLSTYWWIYVTKSQGCVHVRRYCSYHTKPTLFLPIVPHNALRRVLFGAVQTQGSMRLDGSQKTSKDMLMKADAKTIKAVQKNSSKASVFYMFS